MSDTEKWTHDYCGGTVDTSSLYWKCTFCGAFVWASGCSGNSDAAMSGVSEIPDNPTGEWAKIKQRRGESA